VLTFDGFFGLILVEALAAGTPVIRFARGSVAEIVEDGVTGVLGQGSGWNGLRHE